MIRSSIISISYRPPGHSSNTLSPTTIQSYEGKSLSQYSATQPTSSFPLSTFTIGYKFTSKNSVHPSPSSHSILTVKVPLLASESTHTIMMISRAKGFAINPSFKSDFFITV